MTFAFPEVYSFPVLNNMAKKAAKAAAAAPKKAMGAMKAKKAYVIVGTREPTDSFDS